MIAVDQAPYYSTACRIGTHSRCDESEPKATQLALSVSYEACVCRCHLAAVRGATTPGD